jgi:hypothetical protein
MGETEGIYADSHLDSNLSSGTCWLCNLSLVPFSAHL